MDPLGLSALIIVLIPAVVVVVLLSTLIEGL